jgi:hypothetical protein
VNQSTDPLKKRIVFEWRPWTPVNPEETAGCASECGADVFVGVKRDRGGVWTAWFVGEYGLGECCLLERIKDAAEDGFDVTEDAKAMAALIAAREASE